MSATHARLIEIVEQHEAWRKQGDLPLLPAAVQQVFQMLASCDARTLEALRLYPTPNGGLKVQARGETRTALVFCSADLTGAVLDLSRDSDEHWSNLTPAAAAALAAWVLSNGA